MIRKFNDHGEALKFGREFSTANGCHVVAKSVYLTGGGGSSCSARARCT